jgi:hypothetical protein
VSRSPRRIVLAVKDVSVQAAAVHEQAEHVATVVEALEPRSQYATIPRHDLPSSTSRCPATDNRCSGAFPDAAHADSRVSRSGWYGKAPRRRRATYVGNRQRTIKLLDLLTVGYHHRADEPAFAVAMRNYLEGHHARPQLVQRQFDDINGSPSLST